MRPHTLYLPSTVHHPSLRSPGQVINEQIFAIFGAMWLLPTWECHRRLVAVPWMPRAALAQLGSRGVLAALNPCQEMLCRAGDFITAHCNPTTMEPLELGPEPEALEV